MRVIFRAIAYLGLYGRATPMFVGNGALGNHLRR